MVGIPQIQIDQLRKIVRQLYELDNDTPLEPSNDLTDEDIVKVIKSGEQGIGNGSQFTLRQLLWQPDWDASDGWRSAEHKQLDAMEIDKIFGLPTHPPKGATILQTIWSYIKKPNKKKAQNCCNGKQLKRQNKCVHKIPIPYYHSYSFWAGQVEMRFFLSVITRAI